MNNRLWLLTAVAIGVAAIAALLIFAGDPPAGPALPDAQGSPPPSSPMTVGNEGVVTPAGIERERVAAEATADDAELDPEIRAALCGFRGRVIDHAGAPVPDFELELVRFGIDSVFASPGDGSAFAPALDLHLKAGETSTGEDGRFQLNGVWPQGFYAFVSASEDHGAMLVVVEQTPGPGEIVDLGDIQLAETATIVGRVVDDEGGPVAGATIRAADIPGTITAFFPIERLDPTGAVIVHEDENKMVIDFPAWAERIYDTLPVPETLSGEDGTFRLTGVPAGNNLVAITAPRRLGHVEPRVRLEPGEERDLGEVKLSEGEEVWGRVVDKKGEPVAGAEVLVGQILAFAPVALASWAEPTNERGEFSLAGFAGGKVIAAARRKPGDSWVIGDAQPAMRDIVLQLPSLFTLDVQVIAHDGTPIPNAELRLFPAMENDELEQIVRFGVIEPADVKGRLHAGTGESAGAYRIEELGGGHYRLEVTAPGHAVAAETLLVDRDLAKTIKLEPSAAGTVLVQTEDGKPVRHARIYLEVDGQDLPEPAGRTGTDGRMALERAKAGPIKVFAQHPAYGSAAAEGELPGKEIRLVLATPGDVVGVLTEDGAPAPAGKYMIVASHRSSPDEPDSGAIPRLAAPDAEGNFLIKGLQPGRYQLDAVPSASVIRSMGSIFKMAQQAMLFFNGDGQSTRIDVRSAAVTRASIHITTDPGTVEGPAGRIAGSVFVNGKPGTNMAVMTWSNGRRSAMVGETGQFDLGTLSAGSVNLRLYDLGDTSSMLSDALWKRTIELGENQDLVLDIVLDTGELSGQVLTPDGSPVGRCNVEITGVPYAATGELSEAATHIERTTDDAGAFHFDRVPAGVYRIATRGASGRGERDGVAVLAGVATSGIELKIKRTLRVKGTVDVSRFGGKKPRWIWMEFQRRGTDGPDTQSSGADAEGRFEVRGLLPGTYDVRIHAYFERTEGGETSTEGVDYESDAPVTVTDRDLEGIVLRPVEKPKAPSTPEGRLPTGRRGGR